VESIQLVTRADAQRSFQVGSEVLNDLEFRPGERMEKKIPVTHGRGKKRIRGVRKISYDSELRLR
jgi:hypothetical protein